MSIITEFKTMISESNFLKWSVFINLLYVLSAITVNLYGIIPFVQHPLSMWTWSSVFNQYISFGFDFAFFLHSAYNFLFNMSQIVIDPAYLLSIPFRDLPL